VDTASTDGIFDVSNADRLGFSEVELVQKVVDGVELLIKVDYFSLAIYVILTILLIQMEKKLEVGESIEDLIPK
jgi:creatine kinase